MSKRGRVGDALSTRTPVIERADTSHAVVDGVLQCDDGEAVEMSATRTQLYIGALNAGSGTVYITSARVAWTPEHERGTYNIRYPSISLHAVCRDLEAYPQPCIYLMLDNDADAEGPFDAVEEAGDAGAAAAAADGTDSADAAPSSAGKPGAANKRRGEDGTAIAEPDLVGASELRFVPEDAAMLGPLFAALSTCAALHPPEGMSDDEDGEGYGGGFYGADEEEDGEEEGEGEGEGVGVGVHADITSAADIDMSGFITSETELTSQQLAALRVLEQRFVGGPARDDTAAPGQFDDAPEADDGKLA